MFYVSTEYVSCLSFLIYSRMEWFLVALKLQLQALWIYGIKISVRFNEPKGSFDPRLFNPTSLCLISGYNFL